MHLKKIHNDKIARFLFKNINMKVAFRLNLLNNNIKQQLLLNLFHYDKKSFINKVRNICVFTGRRNGVHRLFRISRIELRREASKNTIYGLRKSSW
jgi:ribosomal protein S14